MSRRLWIILIFIPVYTVVVFCLTSLISLALSIQQPWAWCIVNGHKTVENRTWNTKTRGLIGIHAGKTFDNDGYDWIRSQFPGLELPKVDAFDKGGIVGRANLIDTITELDDPWFFGPNGFIFEDAEPLTLIPCRGQLMFFKPKLNEVK